MPSLTDPRRTVTLHLPPQEYEALAADALEAGYATPGPYAKALIYERGAAPAPLLDQRSAERGQQLAARNAWLLHLFAAALAARQPAGLRFSWPVLPPEQERPRSRAAQERALAPAVREARRQDRAARLARLAAQQAAAGPAPSPPSPASPSAADGPKRH